MMETFDNSRKNAKVYNENVSMDRVGGADEVRSCVLWGLFLKNSETAGKAIKVS